VRIFGGIDPATGKQLILTGSAATEADAIVRYQRHGLAAHPVGGFAAGSPAV
jgi:hypothetical protein